MRLGVLYALSERRDERRQKEVPDAAPREIVETA